jgi:hypothetical protein
MVCFGATYHDGGHTELLSIAKRSGVDMLQSIILAPSNSIVLAHMHCSKLSAAAHCKMPVQGLTRRSKRDCNAALHRKCKFCNETVVLLCTANANVRRTSAAEHYAILGMTAQQKLTIHCF